jgi:hypothetical protein
LVFTRHGLALGSLLAGARGGDRRASGHRLGVITLPLIPVLGALIGMAAGAEAWPRPGSSSSGPVT